jgi:hypothetical protein
MTPREKAKPYTEADHAFIVENVAEKGTTFVAEALGRTPEAIRVYCKRHKIKIGRKEWTEEEEKFLRDNILTMRYDDIAKALGKTQSAVTKYANTHGLCRTELAKREIKIKPRPWTPDDIKYLRANVATKTFAEIGQHLGRTESAVTKFANTAGIKRKQIHVGNPFLPQPNAAGIKVEPVRKGFVSFDELSIEDDYQNHASCIRDYLELAAENNISINENFVPLPEVFYSLGEFAGSEFIRIHTEEELRMYDDYNLIFVKYTDELYDLKDILRELPKKCCGLSIKSLIISGEYEVIMLTQRNNPDDWIGIVLVSNKEFAKKDSYTFNILLPFIFIKEKHRGVYMSDFMVENLVDKFFDNRDEFFFPPEITYKTVNFVLIAPELNEIGLNVFNYFAKGMECYLSEIKEEILDSGCYLTKIIGNTESSKIEITPYYEELDD